MIDMHVHTTYSDGELKAKQIKDIMTGNKIWSVADHNDIRFHINYKAPITGCELSSSVIVDGKEQFIELLAYDFDTYKFLNTIRNIKTHFNNLQVSMLFELEKKLKSMGCILEEPISLSKGFAHLGIYENLIKNEKNYEILGDLLNSGADFFHNGQSEGSAIYISQKSSCYSFNELCNKARSAGAKLFLAHPHYYKNVNTLSLINSVLGEVDGIECIHPSATESQSVELLDFCVKEGKLASIGSDHHKNDYVGAPNSHLIAEYGCLFTWTGI